MNIILKFYTGIYFTLNITAIYVKWNFVRVMLKLNLIKKLSYWCRRRLRINSIYKVLCVYTKYFVFTFLRFIQNFPKVYLIYIFCTFGCLYRDFNNLYANLEKKQLQMLSKIYYTVFSRCLLFWRNIRMLWFIIKITILAPFKNGFFQQK